MSYCLNPHCQKPQNHEDAKFCLNCGTKLMLKERYRAIKPIGERTFLGVDEHKLSKPPCIIKYINTIKPPTVNVALPKLTPVYLDFIRNICKILRYCISCIWIFLKRIFLKKQDNNTHKTAELFEQEAEKLGKHNQIPELLAYFTQDENKYLVQEYIDGHNLLQILTAKGKFNEKQIWKLLNNLLPVLDYIHNHQLIHGDIKPKNIICRQNGKLFLVGFSYTKIITGTSILKTKNSIENAEIFTNEQIKNKNIYSNDLYRLGLTCIYLLTGISPFKLFDTSQKYWMWRCYLVDNPVSDKLCNIIDKLVDTVISNRYQSAREVLEHIDFHKKNTLQNKENISHTTLQKASSSNTVQSQSAREVLEDIYLQEKTYKNKESINDKTQQKSPIPPKVKALNYDYWRYIYNFTGHSASIDSVAISPNGNILASGSHDCTIILWEINSSKQIQTINTEHIIYTIVFSPNGSIIASCGFDNKIQIWDVNSGKKICTLKGHIGWFVSVNSLTFSADCRIIISAGSDKTIKLWDLNTGSEIHTFVGHDTWVGSVAISPDGKILASGSGDKKAILWNLSTGEKLNILSHSGILSAINSVAFSSNGKMIATASEDKTIKLWEVISGQEICTLKGHLSSVKDIVFNPKLNILASSSYGGDIKLWDMNTKQVISTLDGHSAKVNSLVFSPDGRTLFSGSEDKTIKVWRCE